MLFALRAAQHSKQQISSTANRRLTRPPRAAGFSSSAASASLGSIRIGSAIDSTRLLALFVAHEAQQAYA